MIQSVHISNFKVFKSIDLTLNDDLNIIVGNNEAGKSTILEAIGLALTKRIGGRQIDQELSPYLFNKECAKEYLSTVKSGKKVELPKILIELYLKESPELEPYRGTNNSRKLNTVGLKIEIVFDEDYKAEYQRLLEDSSEKKVIPAEYYKVNWYSFANSAITARSLPINVFYIDATSIRLQSGTDYFIQTLINDGIAPKERVALAVAYRKLKEDFGREPSIQGINKSLNGDRITEKDLTITIDISQKTNWETNLVPHLDDLPFHLSGKGEQTALKIMLALERKAKDSDIILIEEPENHLSYSFMSRLISKIGDKCTGKQILITTHSAYVLNRLGIEKVHLLHGNKTTKLQNLPADTQNYFKKLSGYDTLRLILAKKAILVEGPSDELIIQKAWLAKHGKLPLEMGADVINVRGLSFSRFLDIAKELGNEVSVVTDNDGDYKRRIEDKYAGYRAHTNIKICADSDNSAPTLEPQIIKYNKLEELNKILGTTHADEPSLVEYMTNNKTECALAIFEAKGAINFPTYITNAVQ